MLAIVVAILFVLLVLIFGLHISQSRAVRGVTQGEAELQFRESFEFAVAKLLSTEQPVPDDVKVSADVDEVKADGLATDYAKNLFSTDGLPNLDPTGQEHAPGFNTYEIDPSTLDAALNVFSGRKRWLVTQSNSGYAVYAPKGKIQLEKAMGWANPTLDDDKFEKTTEAYSGVPVLLAASGDIEVSKLIYGQAYTSDGDLTLDGESFVGFKGHLPLRPYETALTTQLESLKATMIAATLSGDKTNQIEGNAFKTAGDMVGMMFGGSSLPSLSLEQAIKVPFPSIPGGSATIPGIFYEFWLHVPYPPDFAEFDDPSQRNSQEDAKEAKRLNDEIKKLDKEIADLKKDKQKATTQSEKDDIQDKINKKEDKKHDLEKQAKDLQDAMEEDAKRRNDAVGNNIGSPADVPETREDDEGIPKKTGITGWAYGPVFSGFGEFLLKMLTGDFKGLAGTLYQEVRVVHFGKKTNVPKFEFDNGFLAQATLNVPPGRSFRYSGNLELEGDLWLQKGSTMYVGGDLTLDDPNSSKNPFKASGKLVMEEGSTLVVDGDVTLAGSPYYGSLWVCSPAGKLKPISTAIMAKGTVTVPYGSFTSTSLQDAAIWLASKESSFDFLPGVLETVFQDIAPNLAKIAGPFHTRRPYFASYATTFQLTMVPTPVGEIPIPSCIPLPRKNVLIPIFRAFTYLYTPTLNASLGENFVTYTDWWPFGQGNVPSLVKLDPKRMIKGLSSIHITSPSLSFDFDKMLDDLQNKVLKDAVNFVVETIVKKVIKQVATSFLPFGGVVGEVVDVAMDQITTESDTLEQLQQSAFDATIGQLVKPLEDWFDDMRLEVENGLAEGFLREVNGPLIYADRISVGEGNNAQMFAGMLVAKSNITIEATSFVGSLVCTEGDITAQNVYFTPYFTQASLYKPKATDSNWLTRMAQYQYGKNFDSQSAAGVASGVNIVRTEGWNK